MSDFEKRPRSGDDRKARPAGGRSEGPTGRGERREGDRPEWQKRVERPRSEERSPLVPSEITPEDLDFAVRVQLKTLTAENAEMVARHLAMVGLLIETDPALAHRHAKAASQRAGRLAVVHETVGITAYAIADYPLAIRELLTHRRLSGSNDQLPLIVDSERGMGRPARALDAARDVDRSKLSPGVRINLAIALSGARLDLNQPELALQELEIAELSPKSVIEQSPALFVAYGECLTELGRTEEASNWFTLADRADAALDSAAGENVELIEEIVIPSSSDMDASRAARPARGSYGEREQRGERKFGSRPERSSSERSSSERPSRERPQRDSTDRPRTDRPRTDRPRTDRPRTDRPRHEKPRDRDAGDERTNKGDGDNRGSD